MRLDFYWDLMEVVQLVSDHTDEVADRLKIIFSVEINFRCLYYSKDTKMEWNYLIQLGLIIL